MKVDLFGVGIESGSRAVTAEKRINCYVERREQGEKTQYVLIGRPSKKTFVDLGAQATRGMWAVNTLAAPLLFVLNGQTLYSVNNAAVVNSIGNIETLTGDVSMVDDGTYLVLTDGTNGWVYNMSSGTFTKITSGNFTTSPRTVTWQDNYFIVTASANRQFQFSQISPSVDPTVWPANQIGFAGSGGGALRNGISDHSVLALFGDTYSEFWQNTGSPDLPFSQVSGAGQQFGLIAPWSVTKFNNSLAGLFQDNNRAINVAQLSGFSLRKISTTDLDNALSGYTTVTDGEGYSFMVGGHPFYVLHLHSADHTWVYDGLSNVWSEWTNSDGTHFAPHKSAVFQQKIMLGNENDGKIETFDNTVYQDNDGVVPMEVQSKHLYADGKMIGISYLKVEIEAGVGVLSGQGSDPVMDLQVSQDGGNTFYSVGYRTMGKLGDYTSEAIWGSLGAARDWVLKLRITDPVKRIITGASMEIQVGRF